MKCFVKYLDAVVDNQLLRPVDAIVIHFEKITLDAAKYHNLQTGSSSCKFIDQDGLNRLSVNSDMSSPASVVSNNSVYFANDDFDVYYQSNDVIALVQAEILNSDINGRAYSIDIDQLEYNNYITRLEMPFNPKTKGSIEKAWGGKTGADVIVRLNNTSVTGDIYEAFKGFVSVSLTLHNTAVTGEIQDLVAAQCKNGKMAGSTSWLLPKNNVTLNGVHPTTTSISITFSSTGATVVAGETTRTYNKSTNTWS